MRVLLKIMVWLKPKSGQANAVYPVEVSDVIGANITWVIRTGYEMPQNAMTLSSIYKRIFETLS